MAGIKRILQQEKRKQTDICSRCEKSNEFQRQRIVVETVHSEEAAAALSEVEMAAREQYMVKVIQLRQRCQEKWLTWGDAPFKESTRRKIGMGMHMHA